MFSSKIICSTVKHEQKIQMNQFPAGPRNIWTKYPKRKLLLFWNRSRIPKDVFEGNGFTIIFSSFLNGLGYAGANILALCSPGSRIVTHDLFFLLILCQKISKILYFKIMTQKIISKKCESKKRLLVKICTLEFDLWAWSKESVFM